MQKELQDVQICAEALSPVSSCVIVASHQVLSRPGGNMCTKGNKTGILHKLFDVPAAV